MKIVLNDLSGRIVVKAPWLDDGSFATDTGGAVVTFQVFSEGARLQLLGILKSAVVQLENK